MKSDITMEPRVAVVGVGGAGCNIVGSFYGACAPVDTIAINTDKAAMEAVSADRKVYICKAVTKGEGTKGDMRLGKKCAKVHEEEIEQVLVGHDIVFVVAGLGGGTGTGAASVVAEICNRLGIMTFVVAINPFSFETTRTGVAGEGLRSIRAVCPTTFVVENDKILDHKPDATLGEAMRAVNESVVGFVMKMVDSVTEDMTESLKTVKPNAKPEAGHKMADVRDIPLPYSLET